MDVQPSKICSRSSSSTWQSVHTCDSVRLNLYKYISYYMTNSCSWCPPLWARWQHACLLRSGPGFDPRSGQVSWVRFFRGFSSPVRQMSGSFRPPRSPNIIWPSLSSSLIIHYGHQWPEMLTHPKFLNIHTYIALGADVCTCHGMLLYSCKSFGFFKFFFQSFLIFRC